MLTGLPSLALPDGTSEGGPADVSFMGNVAYVTVGLGGDPAVRVVLGDAGALLGKQLMATPAGAFRLVSAVPAHEARDNPAGDAVDSNPYTILALPGRQVVADSGGNTLIEVLANGRTRTFAAPSPLPSVPPIPRPRQTVAHPVDP